jgi:hypothetical protein
MPIPVTTKDFVRKYLNCVVKSFPPQHLVKVFEVLEAVSNVPNKLVMIGQALILSNVFIQKIHVVG